MIEKIFRHNRHESNYLNNQHYQDIIANNDGITSTYQNCHDNHDIDNI